MFQAACTGSRQYEVPGTRAPPGTTVPGMMGPKCLVHSGKRKDNSPQPKVSIKHKRAVFMASAEKFGSAST